MTTTITDILDGLRRWHVEQGHVLDSLAAFAAAGVRARCCVTSPPYFGLRDYKTAPVAWPEVSYSPMPGLPPIVVPAQVGHLGGEATPEAFVGHLVEVFRGVRRVLDGVLWLNIGDSFATQPGKGDNVPQTKWKAHGYPDGAAHRSVDVGVEPMNLLGIPWRLAFALQADGWLLRNDVVWAKQAAMPESVSGWRWERCRVKVDGGKRGAEPRRAAHDDRPQQDHDGKDFAPSAKWAPCPGCPKCAPNDGLVLRRGSWRHTRAHEMVFMLATSPEYFADGEAVREAIAESSIARWGDEVHDKKRPDGQPTHAEIKGGNGCGSNPSGRNPRTIFTPSTKPLRADLMGVDVDHFAAFPPGLVAPLVRASTSERGSCPTCRAPWVRVVERVAMVIRPSERRAHAHAAGVGGGRSATSGTMLSPATCETLDWRPTCDCGAPPHADLVIDPFNGSGTTGAVSVGLGLRYLGCELNPEYARIYEPRIGHAERNPNAFDELPRAGKRDDRQGALL